MKKFGLIGFPLGHSFSRNYFNSKFLQESITDCSYSNFEIPDIHLLTEVLKDPELQGLNVTIPYKKDVIPFLHTVDSVVRHTGACNCIRIQNHQLHGYNTDVTGFEKSFMEKWTPGDHRALILGTGGSSKAVAYVLNELGIDFLFVSRNHSKSPAHLQYAELTEKIIRDHPLIINCTPLGMYPEINALPPLPYEFLTAGHYLFDLIYNPASTQFLQKGEAAGARVKNGADMLKIQADASWEIWNPGSER
ncbi:MAG: shikimate dehydrogenase [Bacteroidota bacterium]|nr:shikimate dehydrogenase [Bacteroidota bacterium]MDP4212756.1 shikimate dehydrogenase [Bacteroidota bacterium]MDP4249339.1 shikimate dehydrogenase [Bacteroidota bacterium]